MRMGCWIAVPRRGRGACNEMASSRASGVRRMVSGLLLLLLCAQQPLHAFGVHGTNMHRLATPPPRACRIT
jgi:hypothetical protein